MAQTEDEYRRELTAYFRRSDRLAGLLGLVWMPLALSWRIRRARASGDPWAWAAIVLTLLSLLLGRASAARRAEQRAEQDLAVRAQARENRRRVAAGLPQVWRPDPDVTPTGCLAQVGFTLGGLVQTALDYRRRPDRARRVVGRRWRLRPGPAWWTAWSFQQLPGNAASRAPRAAQIGYERRQLLTLAGTQTATAAAITWQRQLRPGWRERDRLRVAAGAVTVALPAVRGVADYRLVPLKVDEQRARRRRHDAAVAELIAARAAGLPGPANPWRADVLLTAATATAGAVTLAAQAGLMRRKPQHPSAGAGDASVSGAQSCRP